MADLGNSGEDGQEGCKELFDVRNLRTTARHREEWKAVSDSGGRGPENGRGAIGRSYRIAYIYVDAEQRFWV